MPSKKKKYNARFPPARIKKIMQTDEEVGKVASAVPVIISRALELFVEGLLLKASEITTGRSARTLTPSHLKRCIQAEPRFDFLKELVDKVPDLPQEEEQQQAAAVGVLPTATIPKVSSRTGRPRGRPRLSSNSNRNSTHQSESETEEGGSDLVVDTSPLEDQQPPRQSVIQCVGHIQGRSLSMEEDGGDSREQAAATLATMATMGSPPKMEPAKPEPTLSLQGCPPGVTIQFPSLMGVNQSQENVPQMPSYLPQSYPVMMPMQYRSPEPVNAVLPPKVKAAVAEDDDYDS